jgi:hypothetical protein
MAQTDQRPGGFRLPWSSDQRSTTEQAIKDGDPDVDPEMTASDTSDQENHDTGDDALIGTVASAETETAGSEAADHPSTESQTVPVDTATPAPATTGAARRAPSKFMADLTKAMLAAAEAQRTETLAQLQTDSKTYTEDIHGRSAGLASDLRKRADDDVAAIREWQKAEIARIKEETDGRISRRKGDLETQLEHHAAMIEQAIDKVQGQVTAFETEMARFFELLIVESDPTRFAAMAENLPEPPPFEGLAIGIEEIMSQAAEAVAKVAPPAKPEVEEAVEPEAVAETVQAEAVAGTVDEQSTETGTEAHAETETEAHAEGATVDDAPRTEAEREAAMNAIAAAFEAAAQAEADASRAEAAAERAESAAGSEDEQAEHGEATEATADGETEKDPRLEALSLSSFDAAEAEAAAGAASDQDDNGIEDIGEDALSKRLGTLVPENVRYPERQNSKSASAATTQVVVVGLVSVASIASFKRHLGRAAGVQSVGVSSGPDGEFVFAVAHGADVSLRDMIPSLPGFQARVTNTGDGVINVTARDPESEG